MNKAISAIALSAVALSTSSAFAQDASWTGPYIGAHVGHAWGDLSATHCPDDICGYPGLLSHGGAMSASGWLGGVQVGYGWADWDGYIGTTAGAPPGVLLPGVDNPDQALSDDGFLGGAQVGYNWQLPSGIVLGVEADITWTDIDASGTFDFTSGASVWRKPHDLSLDYFGTARVRVGYVAGNLLPYVTGGLAWGKTSGDLAVTYTPPQGQAGGGTSYASTDERHVGWTIGAGVEYALSSNLSFKAEYLHIDLGSEAYLFKGTTYHGAPPEFETDSFKSDLTVDVIRVGLNYRFGS